jgi:hypothetical protein
VIVIVIVEAAVHPLSVKSNRPCGKTAGAGPGGLAGFPVTGMNWLVVKLQVAPPPVKLAVIVPVPVGDAPENVVTAAEVLVSEKFAGVPTPLAVAVTVYEPDVALAVNAGAVATPLALVVTVGLPANVPEAPAPGAANVTLTPATGLDDASRTSALRAVVNAMLTVVLCGVPAVAVILAGAPAVFVSEKFADVATPLAVAVTVYEPDVALAVNAGAVATPLALVITVGLPANVPEAPDPGVANVTVTPGTGLEDESRTAA